MPERGVPLEIRFWSKVKKTDACWIWTGCTASGYGMIYAFGRYRHAHRVSWQLAHGPIPKGGGYHGTCVLHKCDNRRCVNPTHLFLGTNAENVRDMIAKGRKAPTHGANSGTAKLTEDDVKAIRASSKSQSVIARTFGIDRANVSVIRSRRSWKHVA